jgi:hypothetical protein
MSRSRCDADRVSELVFIPPVVAALALLLVALRGAGIFD